MMRKQDGIRWVGMKSPIGSRLWATAGVFAVMILVARPAGATLTVTAPNGATRTVDANGDIQPAPGSGADDDPFFKQVQDCFDELEMLGKLGSTQSLVASGKSHKIVKVANKSDSSKVTYDGATQRNAATGAPGAGGPSTTHWQPTNTPEAFPNGTYSDGTPRDPCAALLHELVHAVDCDQGKLGDTEMNTNAAGTQKVLVDEVRACQLQNWMHKAKGMACRTHYGGQQLPKGVLFDKCPDCVTLATSGGPVTAGDLHFEVPVTGTGVAQNSDVPGKVISVGEAGATAVLRKNLDGTMTICLFCGTEPIQIDSVTWKLGDQPLAPADDFGGMPLVCEISTVKVASAALPVPAAPSLRVVKSPEEQTVDENGNITFTITVTNTGTVPINNIQVSDPLAGPAGMYMIPALAPGASDVRMIMFNVGAGTGRKRNVAQAIGQAAGPIQVGPVRDFADFTVQ